MKKFFYVALIAVMAMMTACQQSKEDYIKEFNSFVEKVSEEYKDYSEEQWKEVSAEFEELVKQAEQYEDLTQEEKIELAKAQAKYAGIEAKKGFNKFIDGVKDLFGGKKEKEDK